MFPLYENSSEWDDFGEVINPDDYMRKDEDMDQASMLVNLCIFSLAIVHDYLNFFQPSFFSLDFVRSFHISNVR